MISEPELVGDDGRPPAGADVLDSAEAHQEPGPAGLRARRFWLWALGGAVAASVVWAGGLYAYQTRDPDLGGYRSVDNLCEVADLKALTTALGERGGNSVGPNSRHEVLDQLGCQVQIGADPRSYDVWIGYDLHKKADPGIEFEVLAADWWGDGEGEPLTGVGEKAIYGQSPGSALLRVLDGQAVLTMNISATYDQNPDEPRPDDVDVSALSGIKEFMVEDMEVLMDRLKTAPPPSPSPERS